MPLASLLDFWKRDPETAPNFVAWQTLPARPAQTHPFPNDLPDPVKQTLIAAGIHTLYSHQLEAWTHARAGENVILSTGTASGKTLAYNMPVFATLLQYPNARALYLFPTKALAADQLVELRALADAAGLERRQDRVAEGEAVRLDRVGPDRRRLPRPHAAVEGCRPDASLLARYSIGNKRQLR